MVIFLHNVMVKVRSGLVGETWPVRNVSDSLPAENLLAAETGKTRGKLFALGQHFRGEKRRKRVRSARKLVKDWRKTVCESAWGR